jgi:hypothetical protein
MKWKIALIQEFENGVTYWRCGRAALGEPRIVTITCFGGTYV